MFHVGWFLLACSAVCSIAAESVKLSDLRVNPQKYGGQTLSFTGFVEGVIIRTGSTTVLFRGLEGDKVYISAPREVPEAKPGLCVVVTVTVPPNSGYVEALELKNIAITAPPARGEGGTSHPSPPLPGNTATPAGGETQAAAGSPRLVDGKGQVLQRSSRKPSSSLGKSRSLPSRGADSAFERVITTMLPVYKRTIKQFNPRLDEARVTQIAELILRYSLQHNVDPRLVVAVIAAESNFRLDATSPKGAMGLGQLMPSTAAGMGVSNAYDPEQNLQAAIRLISSHLKKFGNYRDGFYRALAAYNAGSGAVRKYGGVPPFRETINYIWKIYWLYRQLAPDRFK